MAAVALRSNRILMKNLIILVMIFSANKPSTSQKRAQNVMFHVHMAPEEAFEQGHVINRKIFTQQT